VGWSVGVFEWWSVGVLECWSVGVLECWSVGVLECWSDGAPREDPEGRDHAGGPGRTGNCPSGQNWMLRSTAPPSVIRVILKSLVETFSTDG